MDWLLQYAGVQDLKEQLIHLAKIRLVDPAMIKCTRKKDNKRKPVTKLLNQLAEITGCESPKSNLDQIPFGSVKFKFSIL